jgi:phthalate 4,5-cis-dihydrodiol dehydrogenase
MSALKIGFVGLGNQAKENLLPALAQINGARIAALCDIDREKAERMRGWLGASHIYSDLDQMIDERVVDLIVMACPPQVHFTGALAAIRAGIPVFVEKPPCLSTKELELLIEEASGRDVITGVGLNFRHSRAIERVQRIIQSERFGGLSHLSLRHYANKPRAPMWGLDSSVRSFLLAQTIHTIDLAMHLGGPFQAVRCEVDAKKSSVLIRMSLNFAGTVTAAIVTGSAFPAFEFGLEAVGANHGLLTLDNLWNVSVRDEAGGAFSPGEKRWSESWQPGPLDSGYVRAGYAVELQAFVDAVAAHERFDADFSAMLPTYQVIDAVCAVEPRQAAFELAAAE